MTNKNKRMLGDDAMAAIALEGPSGSKKKGGKGSASRAVDKTETCGCAIF